MVLARLAIYTEIADVSIIGEMVSWDVLFSTRTNK